MAEIINFHGTPPGMNASMSWPRSGYAATFGWPATMASMTAIASAYAPGGFSIGADGLRRDASGQVVTWNAQKLFPIHHKDFVGAYAWTGATSMFYADREPFHFIDESERAGQDMAAISIPSIADYVGRLADAVHTRLLIHNDGDRIPNLRELANEDNVVSGLFLGYVSGEPFRAQVVFGHRNDDVLPPKLTEIVKAPANFGIFSGSNSVWLDMKPTATQPESLSDAVACVRSYLRACVDNRDHYADCVKFGGHVHLASVTPDGFSWIDPPISSL